MSAVWLGGSGIENFGQFMIFELPIYDMYWISNVYLMKVNYPTNGAILGSQGRGVNRTRWCSSLPDIKCSSFIWFKFSEKFFVVYGGQKALRAPGLVGQKVTTRLYSSKRNQNIWNEYVTISQLKRVRDSEYMKTSAIWDHLNIFIIMCRLYHVRTCSNSAM